MPEQVDFPTVIANAQSQGIPLANIAIFYEGLSEEELSQLRQARLLTHHNPANGIVIARFPQDAPPLFQAKAVAVHCLAAD